MPRKCYLIVLVLLAFLLLPLLTNASTITPWIFFDLGKTLIDHAHDYSNMHYLPGVHEYLMQLKKRGYHLGMLINWPEKEGHGNAEKLRLLKEFIAPRWTDQIPFDWILFDAVLFPSKDIYRKPHPFLFIEALRTAAPNAVVYQGEDKEEFDAARNLGLATHCVSDGHGGLLPLVAPDDLPKLIRESFIYGFPGSGK